METRSKFRYRNLPLLLLRAREALMQERRPELRARGLSDQQWRVLRVLRNHPQGLETGLLAEQAFILGPSLTGILSRMERAELVERERSAEDARSVLVRSTPRGQELSESLSGTIEMRYEALAETLGPSRLRELYALLDALIALPEQEAPAAAEERLEV